LRSVPIEANGGFSTPFLLKITSRSTATLIEAGLEAFDCNSISHGFEDGTLNGWVCGLGHKESISSASNFKKPN